MHKVYESTGRTEGFLFKFSCRKNYKTSNISILDLNGRCQTTCHLLNDFKKLCQRHFEIAWFHVHI